MTSQTCAINVPVGVLFYLASFISHCSIACGGWVLGNKAQKRTDTMYTEETFLYAVTHQFWQINWTAYQNFPLVSVSVRLGGACNSDIYSIQRTQLR